MADIAFLSKIALANAAFTGGMPGMGGMGGMGGMDGMGT